MIDDYEEWVEAIATVVEQTPMVVFGPGTRCSA
jgi:hypothetical protein